MPGPIDDFSLTGKTVVVVGSTYGIGAETARYLGGLGANVLVTGRSDEKGSAIVDDILSNSGSASFVHVDIGVEDDVKTMIGAAVDRYGRLDAIVNNAAASDVAASGGENRLAEQTNEGFEAIMRIGVWGLFWCCKYGLQQMVRQRGGSIVNISSTAAVRGISGISTYSMTKGAMLAMTRNIAVDYGNANIRANAIVTGTVPVSEISTFLANHPTVGPAWMECTSLGRLGEGKDVARAVAFLASDASSWITGTELFVDGGAAFKAVQPDMSEALGELVAQLQATT